MIKTPITDSVSTSITATLTASPLEDAGASGGDSASRQEPTPPEDDREVVILFVYKELLAFIYISTTHLTTHVGSFYIV